VQAFHKVEAVFDDPNLIGSAGLVPVMRLAERAGLHDLLRERLSVPSPNAASKAACVVAGMLAGADCIDDLDVLRHGGMDRVFAGVRAPSTVGTFLRTFTFGHVRQLDAVAARVVAGLATGVPRLLAGSETLAFVDIDDTIREVHGYQKQGAAYGYSGVKGLNAQLAVLSSPTCAPVIAAARLRKGNAVSGHGAHRLIGDAVATARAAGVSGQVMVRADSGYYRRRAWFSVTVRMNPAVTRAIAAIPEGRGPRSGTRALSGTSRSSGDLRSPGRRDHRHRVHLSTRQAAGSLPARRAPGPAAQPGSGRRSGAAVHPVASPRFVTNSSLATVAADWGSPRLRGRPTGTTPSLSRSSPS